MKRLLLVIFLTCFIGITTKLDAQVVYSLNSSVLPAYYDPVKHDTVAVIKLGNVYCFNKKKFTSAKHEQNYWRMVNDVKKTLPVAKAARDLMAQVYDTIQYMPKSKEQRKYFKKLEKDLLAQYKPQLKQLNYRQGKLLVRLIDRECNRPSYSIIREFMGKTRAFFWQTFGLLFGVSLKNEWDPNGKDKELEDVCIQVEQGLI
ncbi:MAG: DUF4294 domain-containing protein [Bacteroidales bacterium]|nr:DUF4294 domain-containing protein [Bacteroidales bacterium]